MSAYARLLLVVVIVIVCAAGCTTSATDTPTPVMPTPTPATAQGRLDAYWLGMQAELALLKQTALATQRSQSKRSAFGLAVGIPIIKAGLDHMQIPSDSDLQSIGLPPGLDVAHASLLKILRPCFYTGFIGMDAASYTTEDLMLANSECLSAITSLEESHEMYVELFKCPENHPLASLCHARMND